MKLKYLGHSAFYIDSANVKMLIDPFITGNPTSGEHVDHYYNIDYIFVTHGHGDHLGDTVSIGKKSGATVVTNFEIANYLSQFQLNCHGMHIGGRHKFDFGTVKMTPALHGSGIQTDHGMIYGGNPAGFVIEVDGVKIYHAGDTGLTMDMQLLARENIDIALLPIGGNFTMDSEDAQIAVEFIKPKMVVPMHYNTFEIITVNPEDFVAGLPENVSGRIMKSGETIEISL